MEVLRFFWISEETVIPEYYLFLEFRSIHGHGERTFLVIISEVQPISPMRHYYYTKSQRPQTKAIQPNHFFLMLLEWIELLAQIESCERIK